jgi:hypothetical protein
MVHKTMHIELEEKLIKSKESLRSLFYDFLKTLLIAYIIKLAFGL